jgi:hypothetical protein
MNFYLFYYSVLLSSLIPVIFIGVQQRITSKQTRLRSVFFLFILARFLTDLGNIISEKVISNSLPVFHFSILIQFVLILELFYTLHRYKFRKEIFLILALVFFILDLTVTSSILQNNHLSTMYTYIVISGFGIRYLFNITGDYFQKIIFCSISIYTIAFTFLLFFEENILKSKELNNYLLDFMVMLSLILNLLFSYAICLKPKN